MHNMAIALHLKGYTVTGSDDEIRDPSRARLKKYGLLPASNGWNANHIHEGLDAVILGMHARPDNPELAKAQELGIKVFSFPEYVYEQTRDKTRVVIGGSHGKTSITSMILHVLKQCKIETDYLVGAQLEGFECMVRLSDTAQVVVLEGDEYLSSPIDRRPKFHLYHPHIALISGIAWDHINVFPTFENYVHQFDEFVKMIEPGGTLVYFDGDEQLTPIAEASAATQKPYNTHPHEIRDGITYLIAEKAEVPIQVFGDHNLQNLNGARLVCNTLGISDDQFYQAIQSFGGAAKRLELVNKNERTAIYKDFAHSPSKLKATTEAMKQQYPNRKLVACMELHTFSSLNADFLSEYNGAMNKADEAYVYFNPQTIAHKKLEPITEEQVKKAFARADIKISIDSDALINDLLNKEWNQANLLLMSSGNFDGVDFDELAANIL